MKPAIITLAAALIIAASRIIYPSAGVIVSLDYECDVVTYETSTGYIYEFAGCEDYTVGDIVCTIMYDTDADGLIYNDVVIRATYSGFYISEGQIQH